MPRRTLMSLNGATVKFGIRPMMPPGGNQYLLFGFASTHVPCTSLMKAYAQSKPLVAMSSSLVAAGSTRCFTWTLSACQ